MNVGIRWSERLASKRMGVLSLVSLATMTIALGCGGRMPEEIGAKEGILAPCPDKPNCVSSFAEDADHQIASIAIAGSATATWDGLHAALTDDSSVEIVTATDAYIHAVYTSSLMRYRDDVEFLLRADENEIAIRSASRVGYGDMGVNRSRVEAIRDALTEKGL